MPEILRVFLSSPGDVRNEREIARGVLRRLEDKPLAGGAFRIEVVAWDDAAGTPMLAGVSPQDSVDRFKGKPSSCDLTVVILWGRLGSPGQRADGTFYSSGTVAEYEDARAADRPILVFRKTAEPQSSLDPRIFQEKLQQFRDLQAFVTGIEGKPGLLKGGINPFASEAEFGPRFESAMEVFIADWLKSRKVAAVPEGPQPRRSSGKQAAVPLRPAIEAMLPYRVDRRPQTEPFQTALGETAAALLSSGARTSVLVCLFHGPLEEVPDRMLDCLRDFHVSDLLEQKPFSSPAMEVLLPWPVSGGKTQQRTRRLHHALLKELIAELDDASDLPSDDPVATLQEALRRSGRSLIVRTRVDSRQCTSDDVEVLRQWLRFWETLAERALQDRRARPDGEPQLVTVFVSVEYPKAGLLGGVLRLFKGAPVSRLTGLIDEHEANGPRGILVALPKLSPVPFSSFPDWLNAVVGPWAAHSFPTKAERAKESVRARLRDRYDYEGSEGYVPMRELSPELTAIIDKVKDEVMDEIKKESALP